MSELEGLGGAVTGAMAGRAVEPYAGEQRDDGHFHENICLNCGTALSGAYCAQCGQKAHLHRSLRSLASDFLQALFNFEGKIWRTLPMLAWRPGEMTRRYIAGERARYVSPVAIYLFSVFLMFAVLNFNGTIDAGETVRSSMTEAAAEQRTTIAELEAQRERLAAEDQNTAELDKKIASEREDLDRIERMLRGEGVSATVDEETPGWVRPIVENASRDPEGFIVEVQDATSKFSWLLIPLSVPFLWLLFPISRRYHLYDHTVFVTYSLAFMMMLVIVGGLLIAVGMGGWASLLILVPPVHMYRQLKGAYQLRWWSALLRTIALTIFAFVASLLFFTAMLGIGVMS